MKTIALHIVFLLLSTLTMAQKPIVFLDIDPKEAEIGEIITITVKSNVQGELDIDLPNGFVHGYNVMNGMEQEMDYNSGKVITYYYMSQTGAMNREGNFTFGPAYIKKGNKAYKSNTVSVTIRKEKPSENGDGITAKQLRQPAFALIERSRNVIYEGESVVLNTKVYSHFSPSHLENYQPYTVSGSIDKHEIGNSQRILVEEVNVKGVTLFTFTYDRNVIFPSGTGRISVDPSKLILRRGFESIPITSSGAFIEVKPLPKPPANFMGGVGSFSMNSSIDKSSLKQGDVFILKLTLSGTGNLHNLLNPKLHLPAGFLVYGDPVITEDFSFGPKGAEGTVAFEYNVQVTKHGSLDFPAVVLSYFDPVKEKYVKLTGEPYSLTVMKDPSFKSLSEEQKEGKVVADKSEKLIFRPNEGPVENDSVFGTLTHWISIGSPLFLALILGLVVRRKQKMEPVLQNKKAQKELSEQITTLFKEAKEAYQKGDDLLYFEKIEKGLLLAVSIYTGAMQENVITKSQALSELKDKGCTPALIDRYKLILDKCEHARYGMGLGDRIELTDNAKELVETLIK
jgi:hypothetical protein